MVCDTCQKKLTKSIGVDPYRNRQQNKLGGVKKIETVKNKLIGGHRKTENACAKCRICKCATHQIGCHYCQSCAYTKGICAMCGKKILDVRQLKQTAV